MVAQPRQHRNSNPKDFNNFWSQRGQDFTQRFSWESDKIPRRSSLKYATSKSAKMAVQFKMADFLLSLAYGAKRLFCRSGCDTYVHRFSSMYVKVGPGAAVLGPLFSHLAPPTCKTNEIRKIVSDLTSLWSLVHIEQDLLKLLRFWCSRRDAQNGGPATPTPLIRFEQF